MISSSQQSETASTKSSIKLPEKAYHIQILLSIIYPIGYKIPDTTSSSNLFELLRMSEKYEIKLAYKMIFEAIIWKTKTDKNEVMSIYAMATSTQNEKLIEAASYQMPLKDSLRMERR